MRKSFITMLCALVLAWSGTVHASALGKVFKRVSGSVVVTLTEEKVLAPETYEGKKISAQGLGSGVLIAADTPTRIGATDNRYRAKRRQDRQAYRFGDAIRSSRF